MRSPYSDALFALIRRMENDNRHVEKRLSMWDTALLRVLKIVIVAFWFFQIDDLETTVISWPLQINSSLTDDVMAMIDEQIIAEQNVVATAAEIAEKISGPPIQTDEMTPL